MKSMIEIYGVGTCLAIMDVFIGMNCFFFLVAMANAGWFVDKISFFVCLGILLSLFVGSHFYFEHMMRNEVRNGN